MASARIAEDYYLILEVSPSADIDTIKQAYKRLAFQLHPDRNLSIEATKAFQLVCLSCCELNQAYETLKDENKRGAYDSKHPTIQKISNASRVSSIPSSQFTDLIRSTQDEDRIDNAKISELEKANEVEEQRWKKIKTVYDTEIAKIQTEIKDLEAKIQRHDNLDQEILAESGWENSWTAWILSPIYKAPVRTEEEKREREEQRQRNLEGKGFRQSSLRLQMMKLDEYNALSRSKERKFKRTKGANERMRAEIEARIDVRRRKELREQQSRERERQIEEMKRQQKVMERLKQKRQREEQERQKKERETWDKWWKEEGREAEENRQKEAKEAAERSRRDKQLQRIADQEVLKLVEAQREALRLKSWIEDCDYDGWWIEVKGYANCQNCSTPWGYLLECPKCPLRACPPCQVELRPAWTRTRGGATVHHNRNPKFIEAREKLLAEYRSDWYD